MGMIQRINSVGHNCQNIAASSRWYAETLGFKVLESKRFSGDWLGELLTLPSPTIERCRLSLGQEILELWNFCSDDPSANKPTGGTQAPCPAGNDAAFQHICVVTSDLHRTFINGAYHSRQISSAPQRLPDWNPAAAGIWAVKFQDPDGYPLELLQFPAGKGNPRWHRVLPNGGISSQGIAQSDKSLCLGLDHTAISVEDMERSLEFYGRILGMTVTSQGHNHGPEQDGMDGLIGTDVLISSLDPAGGGMGIELLNYRKPEGGRRPRANPKASDRDDWRIGLVVDDLINLYQHIQREPLQTQLGPLVKVPNGFGPGQLACQLRDPDGHALLLFADGNP
jgi:catechol 2,3-dioxygenase-like lactoylglutathione lyase family enzyme